MVLWDVTGREEATARLHQALQDLQATPMGGYDFASARAVLLAGYSLGINHGGTPGDNHEIDER